MFDLYPNLMVVTVIAMCVFFIALLSVEFRYRKVLFYRKQVTDLLQKESVVEFANKFHVLYDNKTIIEIARPSFFKLMFSRWRIHIDSFYTKGEQELLFKSPVNGLPKIDNTMIFKQIKI